MQALLIFFSFFHNDKRKVDKLCAVCYNKGMEIVVKKFEELSCDELYAILALRAQVFVVEQNCPYQDLDGIDQEAYHVYAKGNGQIVAYLRVIEKGKRLDEVSIGRVISIVRRQGVGSMLLQEGLKVAKEKLGAKVVKIGAQTYAKPFYERSGFKQISDEYDEDGIPHIYMIYEAEEYGND